MNPFTLLAMKQNSSGGSGGGGVTWSNIFRTSNPPIVGSNTDQTMGATGTLNFSYDGSATYSVFWNGISQGMISSLSVAPGHTVHFQFSSNVTDGGTMTISGLYNTSFIVNLQSLR